MMKGVENNNHGKSGTGGAKKRQRTSFCDAVTRQGDGIGMDNSNQTATFSFVARRKQPQNVPMFNDPKQYVEKSIFHYSTGKEEKQVRRLTMRGSDSTIGIHWSQFGKNYNLGMHTVIQRLGIYENTIDHDNANRTSYWIFESPEVANEVYERILMLTGKELNSLRRSRFAKDFAKEIMN
ncbi:hypothetical protein AX774_g1612 [Zancudomyces culisetae]|uniref:Uncharacterized protein n=1 Tax=Zancudomyces culisetae TaxID=1213189 RepID=A0A1R1PV99_ZANCU|nr:hypothetical protein AX774_g1612 [Zancudomyces culisetae]|eukprot:OMH84853.1 hypothetical protein AX774_g1612 [Zancudomyces culisetae]